MVQGRRAAAVLLVLLRVNLKSRPWRGGKVVGVVVVVLEEKEKVVVVVVLAEEVVVVVDVVGRMRKVGWSSLRFLKNNDQWEGTAGGG